MRPLARSAFLLLVLAGCRTGGGADQKIRLALDPAPAESVLRYYFGSYLGADGGDPVAAGILVRDGGGWAVDVAALAPRLPDGAPLLDADHDGQATTDEFRAFVEATYNAARRPPATLGALRTDTPYDRGVRLDVNGVMTAARRHVYVPEADLRRALAGYRAAGDRIVYPTGTVFVGEHHLGGAHAETTVKRKRADGYWDFFVYDADGRLATATATPPRPLRAPTQCVGCHYGRRAFAPEATFPADAPPGPDGPRVVHTAWRDPAVTAALDEHRKRADHVLGLYGTVYLSRLKAERAEGRSTPADDSLLAGAGF